MDKDSYMLIEQPKYGCSFTEAIKRFYKKYAVFRGRASRSEYWFVVLFYSLVSLAAIVLAVIAPPLAVIISIAFILFCLASIVPLFALYARRLHDVNISAWFIVIQQVLAAIGGILTMNSASNIDITSSSASMNASLNSSFNSVPMLIFNTIPSIIAFILVLLPSKPAGARFDRNMQSMPASPALAQQSPYPAQQSQYPTMSNNVNAGSASNSANNTNGRLMNAQRPTTGSYYAQSAQQQSPYQSQSAYQSAYTQSPSMQYQQQPVNQQSAYYQQPYGMQAVQAPVPTGYQAPQQYTQPMQQPSNDDNYLGYIVEQSQANPNMPKRSHYGAAGNAGSVNMNSFDDTDIRLDNDGSANNANNAR